MGGSAGYYVRFKDLPDEDYPEEGHPEEEGGPIRKYIPIIQFDSQEEALRAAVQYRDQKAEELGLPIKPTRGPHDEQTERRCLRPTIA